MRLLNKKFARYPTFKERGIPVYTEIELGYKVAKKQRLYCGNRNKWKNDNSDFDL